MQPLAVAGDGVEHLAIMEGAFGLLTISLSITYLLSIYPVITRKIALAASLNQETAGRADGVVVARRYIGSGRVEALGDRLRWLNDELLYLGQAHGLSAIGPDHGAAAAYARFRAATDPYVRAYAENAEYDPQAVWATYSRWARDAALVSKEK